MNIANFIQAVQAGDIDQVRTMLSARPELVNIDVSGSNEHRGIHYAVLRRDAAMVRLLMEADTNARKGIFPHRDATSELALPHIHWPASDPRWHWVLIQPIRGASNTSSENEDRFKSLAVLLDHGIDPEREPLRSDCLALRGRPPRQSGGRGPRTLRRPFTRSRCQVGFAR